MSTLKFFLVCVYVLSPFVDMYNGYVQQFFDSRTIVPVIFKMMIILFSFRYILRTNKATILEERPGHGFDRADLPRRAHHRDHDPGKRQDNDGPDGSGNRRVGLTDAALGQDGRDSRKERRPARKRNPHVKASEPKSHQGQQSSIVLARNGSAKRCGRGLFSPGGPFQRQNSPMFGSCIGRSEYWPPSGSVFPVGKRPKPGATWHSQNKSQT